MISEREPEKRRDLAPASGPNPMGGEVFTITEKRYMNPVKPGAVAGASFTTTQTSKL